MSSAYSPIPLQINAPAPSSLLSSVGAFQNIRDQISQIALRHAQTEQANQQAQEYQVQAAQRNKDLADQNAIQEIEKDAASYAKIAAGDLSPVVGKVQDATVQKLRASVNTALQNEATRSTEDLARRGTAHTNIGTSLASLGQLRNPDGSLDLARVNEALPGVIQGLSPDLKILGVDASKIPDSISDEDHLKLLGSRLGAAAALTAAAQKLKEDQATTAQKGAQAASEQSTADLNTYKLSLMKGAGQGDPAARAAAVKGMSIFAGHPQEAQDAADAGEAAFKAALSSSDPTTAADKAAEAVKGVADRLRAFSPGVVAGKVGEQDALRPVQVKTAVQEAAATEPIRARANADAQAYLMKQTGGPLADILDPAERSKVGTEYLKAVDTYSEKAADADRLKQFVAAARTGNQSAAGLMTTAELRSIVNRVNTVELQKAGGAAILRKIENGLDSAGTGIPSEDTLKELEAVADLNDKTAQGAFGQKVRGIKVLSPNAKLSETPPGVKSNPKPIALKDGTFLTPHDADAEAAFRRDHAALIK